MVLCRIVVTAEDIMSKSCEKSLAQRMQPFLIVTLAAAFYVYEFFVRVTPSAMTTELMQDFNIDTSGLGLLCALFFYGYAPMQIPAGLMLDRFGPRLLISTAAFLCGLSTLLFGITHSLLLASAARLIIGISSAFAFVGALVMASRWFSAKYFAFITGLIQFTGSLGAIAGAAPVAVFVTYFGWRSTQVGVGLVGIGLSVLMWICIRSHPDREANLAKQHRHQTTTEWQKLKALLSNHQTLVNGVVAFCAWAPMTVFLVLWGVPFLTKLYDTNTAMATRIIAAGWMGTAIGAPFFGWWSNRINSRRIPLITASIIALIASLFVIYLPSPPMLCTLSMLFLMGLAASAMTVTFGVVQDLHPPSMAGTAVGYTNMMMIGAGVVLQPVVGFILDYLWNGELLNAAPVSQLHDYRVALSCIPFCSIVGLIACLFLKETHCVAQYSLKKL